MLPVEPSTATRSGSGAPAGDRIGWRSTDAAAVRELGMRRESVRIR
jgi:hypothetical protein